MLQFVFGVYLAACVAAYLVPSEVGENVARMRYAAIPLAVLVFSLRRWRPLPVGVAALALAVSWNLTPLAASYAQSSGDTTVRASAWSGAIVFLRTHLEPSYRVEAVDTPTHWAAAYLADAKIPLARGWYRQDDFPQNKVLYDDELGPRVYLRWLRSLGVRYVVLPHAAADYSSRAEAALVRRRLRPVFRTKNVTIYAVPKPQRMITGPGPAALTSLAESRIGVRVDRGGTYRIAVRWSPYWRTSTGCLSKGRDGMLRLTTHAPRIARLSFVVDAKRALDELAGEQPRCLFSK